MSNRGSQSSSTARSTAAERYEVLERHGEGVLFVVYRVRERATLDVLALKALRHSYARHQAFNTAWQQVAQAAIRRRVPHFAQVYEVGVEEGTPYLVEEWLPGHTLEERLRRAPFGRIETSSLARRMAEGLAGLHNEGVIHGDFRPRQVLFSANAELKITDVGWQNAVTSGGLSLVDVFPDSAHYMSPEVWQGNSPTPESDMYALGVTMYRMLAGRLPFDGTSPLAIAQQHQRSAPVRPSQYNPACAPELEQIALGLLHKTPAQRQVPFTRLLSLHSESMAPLEAPLQESPASADTAETPLQTAPKVPKAKRPLTRKEVGKKELKGAILAFFWALVAVALLAGIILGAINFWMKGAPPEVRVPNYVGMNQADAEAILKQRGLAMEVGREVYNPNRPSGTVLGGQPRPDTVVRAGRQVLVTVSRGKEPIRMYNFIDLTLDVAKRIIQKHGLRLGQISNQYHETVPEGSIISQFPEPTQYFHRYDPISLVVSRGPMPRDTSTDTENVADPDDVGTPRTPADTSADDNAIPQDSDPDTITTQDVKINIKMPEGSAPLLVTIVVNDATGEHTVYSEMKQPGDVIDRTVHVAKTPDLEASVQVYAGGQLLREMQF